MAVGERLRSTTRLGDVASTEEVMVYNARSGYPSMDKLAMLVAEDGLEMISGDL